MHRRDPGGAASKGGGAEALVESHKPRWASSWPERANSEQCRVRGPATGNFSRQREGRPGKGDQKKANIMES